MKTPTSQKIVSYLQDHPPVTAMELGNALLLSGSDIRYHLGLLLKAGTVTRMIKYTGETAGRPAYAYTLVQTGVSSGYYTLAQALLDILLVKVPPEDAEDELALLALRLVPVKPESATGAQRMQEVIRILNQMGYKAAWEARAIHPILQLRVCPYLELARQYPHLCRMDQHLLQLLTGWGCETIKLIRDDPCRVHACEFTLIKPN